MAILTLSIIKMESQFLLEIILMARDMVKEHK